MSDQSNILNLSAFTSALVASFIKFKNEHDLDYDEVLIFLALGRMNFEPGSGGLMYVKPASIVAMVAYLDIPRETLRRKMLLLEERGLVQRNGSGYVVKELNDWLLFQDLANRQAPGSQLSQAAQ
ncbi:MAG: hypothetical protein AB7F96_01555 [Beijerinckiaceae bacterium]